MCFLICKCKVKGQLKGHLRVKAKSVNHKTKQTGQLSAAHSPLYLTILFEASFLACQFTSQLCFLQFFLQSMEETRKHRVTLSLIWRGSVVGQKTPEPYQHCTFHKHLLHHAHSYSIVREIKLVTFFHL